MEYCEWSGNYEACRAWLEANHSTIASVLAPGSDQASKKTKKEAKKGAKSKEGTTVTITLLTRNAKKHVTVVEGLGTYEGIDPKDAAKFFANSFSCGAAYIKASEQIEINGDYVSNIADLIKTKWPQIPNENIKFAGEGGSKKGRKRAPGRGGRGRGKRNTIDIGQ